MCLSFQKCHQSCIALWMKVRKTIPSGNAYGHFKSLVRDWSEAKLNQPEGGKPGFSLRPPQCKNIGKRICIILINTCLILLSPNLEEGSCPNGYWVRKENAGLQQLKRDRFCEINGRLKADSNCNYHLPASSHSQLISQWWWQTGEESGMRTYF